MRARSLMLVVGLALISSGCGHMGPNSGGQIQSYPVSSVEAGWIRNGEPLVYEGQQWVAIDDVENMLDSEVYQVGDYKGTYIFVDKLDAKPYDRLYTKFAPSKFRYFIRK